MSEENNNTEEKLKQIATSIALSAMLLSVVGLTTKQSPDRVEKDLTDLILLNFKLYNITISA